MTSTVLIVDDSLTVRMDLAEAFQEAGFEPIPCSALAEARRIVGQRRVGLVILDVLLEDGDGLEWLKEMREQPALAGVPVLLLSSEAEVKDRIRGLKTGADDYVGKPYDTDYLVARAKGLLERRERNPGDSRSTILVIDDSSTYREELRVAFERAGYGVITAASGEEGLRLAVASRPAAVVVDGVLPGIDGIGVIRKIRMDAALRRMPCLLLTGSDDGGAELRALDAGADAFVRKEDDPGIILARLAAVLRSSAAEVGDVASALGPMRILAVDDSPTYLHELAATLRGEGYDVAVARSGEEAIEMLAVQPIDCILLDVVMPGLDGRETCRRIKAIPAARDIPLILLTAIDDRDAMIDGLSTGADDFISKSSEISVLRARVRAQLRRKRFEDEHRKTREDLHRTELEAAEQRAARAVAETKAAMVDQLERANSELEAFGYSASHDLRTPLRAIDGFSKILIEDHTDGLTDEAKGFLRRIRAAAQRMGEIIDDMLALSRVNRAEIVLSRVDVSRVASDVLEELQRREPGRSITIAVTPGVEAYADIRLLRVLFENLLGNAWKFTSKNTDARIEVGAGSGESAPTFFVRDNGAGFDARYASRLFKPFERLHTEAEFPGTGIGLATVHRIVDRHGGRVWAESVVGEGATFFVSLPARGTR
jgi:two-component system NtrC family sensor kinase